MKTIVNLDNIKLPYLLAYYKENYGVQKVNNDLLKQFNNDNNLPEDFKEILKEIIC